MPSVRFIGGLNVSVDRYGFIYAPVASSACINSRMAGRGLPEMGSASAAGCLLRY